VSQYLLASLAELDTITGAFSLKNQKGEIRMNTRKVKDLPQRTDEDTSQAGCRGFESRPPLPENLGNTRDLSRSEWGLALSLSHLLTKAHGMVVIEIARHECQDERVVLFQDESLAPHRR
jgi:hypothetical protein